GTNSAAGTLKLGLTRQRCALAAEAGTVPASALVDGDGAAIRTVRLVLAARLSAESASAATTNHTLAFFDHGIDASKEARRAYEALLHRAPLRDKSSEIGAPPSAANDIRAHRQLADLYQFGADLG